MPHFANPQEGRLATEYWKGRGIRPGVRRPKSPRQLADDNRRRLRSSIGLVVYEDCNLRQLMSFARSKKLEMPKGKAYTREVLAELLYANEGFSRILDLPAELRCRIFQEYFSFWPHPHSNFVRVPPPIIEVNRQLRSEALPEFWGTQRFRMTFDSFWSHVYKTNHIFNGIQLQHLGMIKKLTISSFRGEWELDLAFSDKSAAVRRLQGSEKSKVFDAKFLELLQAIGNRSGSRSLQRSVGTALERIAETSLRTSSVEIRKIAGVV